ncbi:MAG: threonylcarbamoyl-AMP synthase [Lachnospiraceae bacterium]|nr:threonylcarbamoyl-AMP synthase [Lachnospiraceae bacterium]
MTTEKILHPDTASLKRAAAVIRSGGLVAFPTETVYGLGGNALDAEAAVKIYRAKGRPSDNPLIIHLADARDAEKYCVTNEMFYRLADAFCPGPLTVILPKKDCIPYTVTGGLDTVAVRIPSHPIANALIRLAGVPIAAPSANLSGKPSPTRFSHIEHDLDGRVDVLIDGGECDFGVESTIVKPTDDGKGLHLLRPGGITIEMLLTVTDTVIPDKCLTEKLPEGTRPLAPGMMYRHYAPDAPLVLLEGSDEAFLSFVSEKLKAGEDCGVLCYDEDLAVLGEHRTISLGPKDERNTQAHRLFECLRAFPKVERIYSRMPSREGIGLAVFNRLIKAAGYCVIKL